MSSRATRPRSRRGRQTAVELAPVVESLEEAAEGASQECCLEVAKARDQGLQNRPGSDPAGLSSSAPELAQNAAQTPGMGETLAPSRAEDVFETLQRTLSSVEAAVSSWRQPPEQPGEGEWGTGPREGQERAGALPPEAARLLERNGWLRLALCSRERELSLARGHLREAQAERDVLRRELQELQESLFRLQPLLFPVRVPDARGSGSGSSSPGPDGEAWGAQDPFSQPHLLIQRLQGDSRSQMLGLPSTRLPVPTTHHMEARLEQLRGNIEKLKCFNRLLAAVLHGYKGQCEDLSMHLCQREAEATALRLALHHSESCEEAYGALLALLTAGSGSGDIPKGDLEAAEKAVQKLLSQEEAALDTDTPKDVQPSPEGSSVDRPNLWEVATQLRGCIRHLQSRGARLRIPLEPRPPWMPLPTVPHAEAMVHAVLDAQPGPALPRLDRQQIQEELVATREALEDLALSLQLARREKRALELREAAVRSLGPAHSLLLEQLRWERTGGDSGDSGDSEDEDKDRGATGSPIIPGGPGSSTRDPEVLAQELDACHVRTRELQEQLWTLRGALEQALWRGRARRAESSALLWDLCRAHRALVLALRGAPRRQEERRRRLERRRAALAERQGRQRAGLEALTGTLDARAAAPPPRPGETLL